MTGDGRVNLKKVRTGRKVIISTLVVIMGKWILNRAQIDWMNELAMLQMENTDASIMTYQFIEQMNTGISVVLVAALIVLFLPELRYVINLLKEKK